MAVGAPRVVKGYELRELVVAGLPGTVYRAWQPSVRRPVLVRVIPPEISGTPGFAARFEAEALRAARLEHPHILPLYDAWQDETGAYLVARYLPRTLRDALMPGPWPLDAALRLIEQVGLALDAAHQSGLLHLRVAPEVVLLDEQNNAFLAGFVIARTMGAATDETPDPYRAPEQRAGRPASASSDLYSLGVLACEVLTGTAPDPAGESLPPIRSLRSGLPAALAAVLQAATASQPDHRYADCRRFVAALRAAAAPAARPQPLIDPLTERELDVLNLMAQGRDNADIADHLVLSAGTVKWYVKQIYSKLDAHSRDEAVERAGGLGLTSERTESADHPAILETAPAPAAEPPVRSLPSIGLPFIGRERELADVMVLLTELHHPLISLVAPGGMGKTRLAVEAARLAIPHYPDGVVFVPLAASSPAQFPEAVLQALGILIAPERPLWEQVVQYCASRRLLLLLDNFETVISAAPQVAELLAAAPLSRALITSRERLHLEGETVYALGSMEAPPEGSGPPAISESMQLFIERARRVRYGFMVDEANLRHIAEICRLVEGMPLAIVLAASWAEMLPPAEIALEIRASSEFLAAEYGDLPERQRSVRIVFESAWDRLGAGEQRTFARLSVFHGGFTRGAAVEVAGATLHTLAGLVTKALIWTDKGGRYAIHELLRQFAAEHLATTGEAEALQKAHSWHYLSWATRMESGICGPNPAAALDAIDADWPNLRAALLWAAEHNHPEWITPTWKTLWLYHDRHSRIVAGKNMLEEVTSRLSALPDSKERDGALGVLLTCIAAQQYSMWDLQRDELLETCRPLVERGSNPGAIAFWYLMRGNRLPFEEASDRDPYLDEALRRFREVGDGWAEAYMLVTLSWTGAFAGGRDADLLARQRAVEALSLANSLGDVLLQSYALNILGMLEAALGNRAECAAYFAQCLAAARTGGDRKRECNSLNNLALQHMNWGMLDSAQTLMEASLTIRREILPFVFIGYEDLGEVFLRKGEFERARPLFAEGESRFTRRANPLWTQIYLLYRVRLAFSLGQWDEVSALVREMQSLAAETGERHKVHFALATEAYGAFARGERREVSAVSADLEALAADGDPVIEAVTRMVRAELARRSGDPSGAASELRATLEVVDSGGIEPIAAGWEDRFTPLQARGLLVCALLDAGDTTEARSVALTALDKAYSMIAPPFVMSALLACARVEVASGEAEYAIEAATLIAESPCAFAADRLQARALLDTLNATIPSSVFFGSVEHGCTLDWQAATTDRLARSLPE
ncbi:MAG: protein kinase [Anaerolineae bacterium]|nr:protein kinase [Anaerolineae bacterium]